MRLQSSKGIKKKSQILGFQIDIGVVCMRRHPCFRVFMGTATIDLRQQQ
jgi:hypothetical protein